MPGVMHALAVLFLIAGAIAPAIGVLAAPAPAAAAPTAQAQTGPAQTAPAEAEGSVAIRLLEAPTNRADDPRARTYIVDHLNPGTSITRRVEVENRTDRAITINVYDAAAAVAEGQFGFADGRGENELTGWTTVDPPSLELAPREAKPATVSINVPAAAAGGERYGVVWAELPGAPGPGGVTLVNRVGVRIYLSVGGGEEPPTSFRLDTFTPIRDDANVPAIAIHACNTGGRAVDLEGAFELFDGPGATRAGPFDSQQATTLAPGECGDLLIRGPSTELPRGPWKARATLRSGATVETAEATITFPTAAGEAAPPVKAERVTESTGGRFAILIALLLLLLALLLLFLLWRRSRKRKQSGEGTQSAA